MTVYNVEVIIETFRQSRDNINYWLSLDNKFKNESAKINYMMAIIKNNINDVDKQWRREQKRKQQEDKVSVDIDMMGVKFENKVANNDISQFL